MEKLQFIRKVLTLKEIKRTGWIHKEVSNPESVAEHTFGVAMLALTMPLPKNMDRNKLIKMALIHDVGECIIGDQVWESGNFSNNQKHKIKTVQEKEAIIELLKDKDLDEANTLALEYLELETPEAKFLKELDKLEMVHQALIYEKKVDPGRLNEFWDNAKKYIQDENILKYFQILMNERSTNVGQTL